MPFGSLPDPVLLVIWLTDSYDQKSDEWTSEPWLSKNKRETLHGKLINTNAATGGRSLGLSTAATELRDHFLNGGLCRMGKARAREPGQSRFCKLNGQVKTCDLHVDHKQQR
jgi:hypothetical protein